MNAPPARVRRQVEENKRFSGIGRSVPFNLIIIVKFREFFALLRFYRPNSLSFIDLFNIFNEYVNSSNYIIKSLKSCVKFANYTSYYICWKMSSLFKDAT